MRWVLGCGGRLFEWGEWLGMGMQVEMDEGGHAGGNG